MRYLTALSSYLSASSVLVVASDHACKCIPNTPCWPSEAEWSLFNKTLAGALIRTTPPASVCYSTQPNYNEDACAIVRSQWFNSTWHAQDPTSIDYPIWANNSCNPIYPNGTSVTGEVDAGKNGCSIGKYPAYVVNATTSEHVSRAFKWAGKRNIRVTVKSTGHSYNGRSTGYGSLSIWTHNFRGISYIPSFIPTSCPSAGSAQGAARIAAGETGVTVQEQMSKYNVIVTTGANPDVGVVGWLTGGGHGTLSTTYGLGADNLLEATIVTPDGKVLLANPCNNPDIFFAIRGGGGGTFGVVLEAVVKAYPTPKTTRHIFRVGSLGQNSSTEFWNLVGFVHSQMADLKAGGMQGFYSIVGPPTYPTLAFVWIFLLYDKPNGTVEKLIAPIIEKLDEQKELFGYQSEITHYDTYWDAYHGSFQNELVANGGSSYGSRLLSPESLSDPNKTAKALAEIGPSATGSNGPFGNPGLLGHLVAPSPSLSIYSPSTLSVLPAWRKSAVHFIVVEGWGPNAPRSSIDAVYDDVNKKTDTLRKLSPDTGAYFNEAFVYEPSWQKTFWGKNYEKLARIKKRVDPQNVLWCRRCVGSEDLEENSIGRLCRVGGKGKRTEDGGGGKRGNVDVQT